MSSDYNYAPIAEYNAELNQTDETPQQYSPQNCCPQTTSIPIDFCNPQGFNSKQHFFDVQCYVSRKSNQYINVHEFLEMIGQVKPSEHEEVLFGAMKIALLLSNLRNEKNVPFHADNLPAEYIELRGFLNSVFSQISETTLSNLEDMFRYFIQEKKTASLLKKLPSNDKPLHELAVAQEKNRQIKENLDNELKVGASMQHQVDILSQNKINLITMIEQERVGQIKLTKELETLKQEQHNLDENAKLLRAQVNEARKSTNKLAEQQKKLQEEAKVKAAREEARLQAKAAAEAARDSIIKAKLAEAEAAAKVKAAAESEAKATAEAAAKVKAETEAKAAAEAAAKVKAETEAAAKVVEENELLKQQNNLLRQLLEKVQTTDPKPAEPVVKPVVAKPAEPVAKPAVAKPVEAVAKLAQPVASISQIVGSKQVAEVKGLTPEILKKKVYKLTCDWDCKVIKRELDYIEFIDNHESIIANQSMLDDFQKSSSFDTFLPFSVKSNHESCSHGFTVKKNGEQHLCCLPRGWINHTRPKDGNSASFNLKYIAPVNRWLTDKMRVEGKPENNYYFGVVYNRRWNTEDDTYEITISAHIIKRRAYKDPTFSPQDVEKQFFSPALSIGQLLHLFLSLHDKSKSDNAQLWNSVKNMNDYGKYKFQPFEDVYPSILKNIGFVPRSG